VFTVDSSHRLWQQAPERGLHPALSDLQLKPGSEAPVDEDGTRLDLWRRVPA
jgi:hypothetical protein